MRSPDSTASAVPPPDVIDRRTYLHNYRMLALDGGLFIGALGFVNGGALLPVIVEKHGGPTWLIALMPVAMSIGFQLTPLLVAHHIDRSRRHMPLLMTMGVGQRVPFMLAGIVLVLGLGGNAGIIAAVAVAPLLSGLFGGISSTAFSQLMIKQIPERRRASLFAVRILIASSIGLVAGYTISLVLDRWPGPVGYGILHLIAFVFLMGSLQCFAWIRETPTPDHELSPADEGLLDNLRGIPAMLSGQRDFVLYLGMRFFRCAVGIAGAFVAVHAVAVLREDAAFTGKLVAAASVGSVIGNLAAGYAGDRWGSKLPTWTGHLGWMLLAGWTIFADARWEFIAIFLLFGIAGAAMDVGTFSMALAVCPAEKRSTYLSLASLVTLAGTLAAAGLATLLRGDGRFATLAVASIIGVGLAVALLIPLREPRRSRPPARIDAESQGV